MKKHIVIFTFFLIAFVNQDTYACSTFMFSHGDELIVGHNLDDFIECPGLVVINKRGIKKRNISWQELIKGRKKNSPRIEWVSKYGSVTYNFVGVEFCDGGMNEAGLYVGEMNLAGTSYPKNKSLPQIWHTQWMQYLLDNFASVEEVIESISSVAIDGTCTWHFFIADRGGNSTIIEFLEGKPVIYSGEEMPVKVLCNSAYSNELKKIKNYEGFGGKKKIDLVQRVADDRFLWAAFMMYQYDGNDQCRTVMDLGWDMLEQLSQVSSASVNKWRVIFDLKKGKLYFRTYLARRVRYVDFSSFDFSSDGPPMILDIHKDLSGDVSKYFSVYDPLQNKKHIEQTFKIIIAKEGIVEQILAKVFIAPPVIKRMNDWVNKFYPHLNE